MNLFCQTKNYLGIYLQRCKNFINLKVILLAGIALRVLYFLKPRSFWGDEWFTIFLAQNNLKEVIFASLKDVHPPLQFILFHFGGYRLFPFIAGVLSLYFFSKLTKDKLTVFLFAISPYFIHLSGETRGYGLLCLFSILVLLGYKWAFPFALFTEHYAWFLLLVIPFSFWFLPFLAGSAGLIFYQMGAEQFFQPHRFEWSIFVVIKKVLGLLIQFGGGLGYSFITPAHAKSLISKSYIVFFILPFTFIFYSRDKRYLKLFFIPILILLIFYPIRLAARYLPFCGIAYLMLIAQGFHRMPNRHKLSANLIMIFFIIVNLFSLSWMLKINYDPYHREDYIAAAQYIKKHFSDNDGLIGSRQQIGYYLKRDFPKKGKVIWEVYLGNPDMEVNYKHWRLQEKKLNRRLTLTKQISELVWIAKYEKQ